MLKETEQLEMLSYYLNHPFSPHLKIAKQLRSNFAKLLGRLLFARSPYYNIFSDCVVNHIPHILVFWTNEAEIKDCKFQ